MSTPQDDATPDRVQTPSISTAPTSGETAPAAPRWWHWGSVPHHLGRARTSTVVLALLFVAVFALYLNVRPDVQPTGTDPAGGSSDVEAPANPLVPSEPTAPETTGPPAPTTEPEPTEGETPTPTTSSPSSPSSSSSPAPTSTTSRSSDPAETTGPSEPATGTSEPDTPSTSSVPAP
jgi:hypothetical protein